MNDEFYIGYAGKTPPQLKRFLRVSILLVFTVTSLLAGTLGYIQANMDRGSFDFGNLKSYEGYLYSEPLPFLWTEKKTYLLVSDGKFGAKTWAQQWLGSSHSKKVRLKGTLIERAPLAMLEIDRSKSLEILEPSSVPIHQLAVQSLGQVDLTGELVDSKCYLGVMRPAVGKVHRGCAIRCLSGGVPPALLLRTPDINTSVLVMLNAERSVPPRWAGRLIRAQGELELRAGVPTLKTAQVFLK